MYSVIIRTYNESRYLQEIINAIKAQQADDHNVEIVIVDSGSTDETVSIAKANDVTLVHIDKSEFTFGHSLNVGCNAAKGPYLVFLSGHCIPSTREWLKTLVTPIMEKVETYAYGRQIGRDTTKFSESNLFSKHYPIYDKIPQIGTFCNNANAAIHKSVWANHKFDPSLTGLEDIHLAEKIVANGGRVAYVSDAPVFHIHNENWRQVRIRYEREAFALHHIHPNIHFTLFDFARYFSQGVVSDLKIAFKRKLLIKETFSIMRFRFNQYWGTYKGHHEHRKLSQVLKHRYFYPLDIEKKLYEDKESGGTTTHQGK